MAEPVIIQLQMRGVAEIQGALRTVEQAILQTERRGTRLAAEGGNARVKIAKDEAQQRYRVAEDENMKGRTRYGWDLRDFEGTEKKKTDELQKWAKQRDRIIENSARYAGRIAEQQANAEIAAARHVAEQRARFAQTMVGHAGAAVRTVAGGAGRVVTGLLAAGGGGFSLEDSIQRSIHANGLAADISNSGFLPAGPVAANRGRRDPAEIMRAAQTVAVAQGLDGGQQEALGGLQKFVAISGNLDAGLKLLPKLAEYSRATGTSLTDMAEAAGNVSLNLGDVDKDGTKTLMVMRGLAAQGKMGAVEIRDLAKQIAKLSSSAGSFDGDLAQNMLKMGAIAQEARGEGGAFSASVAANSIAGFTTTLRTKARVSAFQGAGINVFADKGRTKFRDPEEIIIDALKATGGDQLKMNALFMNIMGKRAVGGFAKRFTDAGGGAKGEAAVRSRFNELYRDSSMSDADMASSASFRTGQADAKMAKLRAEFDEAVSDKIIPKLLELMPTLEQIIPQFVDLAANGLPPFVDLVKTLANTANEYKSELQWLASHPIASIIGLEITKGFADAALPALLKQLFTNAFSGGGAPGSGGGGGGGGAAIGAAFAAGAVILNAQAKYGAGTDAAEALADQVRAGKVSAADAAKEVNSAKGRLANDGTLMTALSIPASVFNADADKFYKGHKMDQALVDNEKLQKAIHDAVVNGIQTGYRDGAPKGMGNGGTPAQNVPLSHPARGGTN